MEFEVNFKIETKEWKSYEFTTSEELYNDEAGSEFDTFRIFIRNDGDYDEIMVANSEDYAIHEYASEVEEVDGLVEGLLKFIKENHENISDHTEPFLEWVEEWLNECGEDFNIDNYLFRFNELSERGQLVACQGLVDDTQILSEEFPNGLTLDKAREVLTKENKEHYYYASGVVQGGMY